MQNGFVESFNGRLRDELLNETLFSTLSHARITLASWRADYNGSRPHSKIGWQTPAAFAAIFDQRRELAQRSAPAPGIYPTCKAQSNRQGELRTG
jgi:putative transposase